MKIESHTISVEQNEKSLCWTSSGEWGSFWCWPLSCSQCVSDLPLFRRAQEPRPHPNSQTCAKQERIQFACSTVHVDILEVPVIYWIFPLRSASQSVNVALSHANKTPLTRSIKSTTSSHNLMLCNCHFRPQQHSPIRFSFHAKVSRNSIIYLFFKWMLTIWKYEKFSIKRKSLNFCMYMCIKKKINLFFFLL